MADRQQAVRVQIYDREYSLRSDSGEEYTRELAKSVDTTMRGIAEKTKTYDSLRLAVLAALHFADECQRLKQRYEELSGAISEKTTEFQKVLREAAGD